jgi:hypothetical protein
LGTAAVGYGWACKMEAGCGQKNKIIQFSNAENLNREIDYFKAEIKTRLSSSRMQKILTERLIILRLR